MKLIKEAYKNTLDIFASIKKIEKRPFEENIAIYLKKLALLSFLAAVLAMLTSTIKIATYYFLYKINIDWINFLNYNLGKSVGTFFAYFIAGTIGITALGLVIGYFSSEKLTITFSKLFYALEPIILIGEFSFLLPGLLVWAAKRYIAISKELKKQNKRKNEDLKGKKA